MKALCRLFGHKRPPLDAVEITTERQGAATYHWTCTRCGTSYATTYRDDAF